MKKAQWWKIKMLLGGMTIEFLATGERKVDAEGDAVKTCMRNGYSAGQFLSVKKVSTEEAQEMAVFSIE